MHWHRLNTTNWVGTPNQAAADVDGYTVTLRRAGWRVDLLDESGLTRLAADLPDLDTAVELAEAHERDHAPAPAACPSDPSRPEVSLTVALEPGTLDDLRAIVGYGLMLQRWCDEGMAGGEPANAHLPKLTDADEASIDAIVADSLQRMADWGIRTLREELLENPRLAVLDDGEVDLVTGAAAEIEVRGTV